MISVADVCLDSRWAMKYKYDLYTPVERHQQNISRGTQSLVLPMAVSLREYTGGYQGKYKCLECIATASISGTRLPGRARRFR